VVDGAPATHASAPDLDPDAPKWIKIEEKLYRCLVDDCTITVPRDHETSFNPPSPAIYLYD
jgi:hypothetical protein